MTRRFLLAVLSVTAIVAAPAPLVGQGAGEVGPALGSIAPSAALEDLDGNAVDLGQYIGEKPTLIEFWATWCEQCEALQPEIDQVKAQFGDDVNIVAIAVAVAQSQRRVRRHLDQHDPGYPFLWDANGEAVRAYKAPTTAVVILVNSDGTVAYTGVGAEQDLVGAVTQVLTP